MHLDFYWVYTPNFGFGNVVGTTLGYRLIFGTCENTRVTNLLRQLNISTLGELAEKSQYDMELCKNVGKGTSAYVLGRLKKLKLINDAKITPISKCAEILIISKREELMTMHPATLIQFTLPSALALWQGKIMTIEQLANLSTAQLNVLGVSAKEIGKIKRALKAQGIDIH